MTARVARSGGRNLGFGWRKRNHRDAAADQDSALADANAAASERLRALARRATQGEIEPPSAVIANVPALALAANPFALLDLEIASGVQAINSAYDQLSFEHGRDEAALAAARAALMSPRERLIAEIRWMPGLPSPTIKPLCAALRANDASTLTAIRGKAAGIARFNVAFALFEAAPTDTQAALGTIAAAHDVEHEALLDALDEARFTAREREIDRCLFDECLDDWAQHTGNKIAIVFAANPIGRLKLVHQLQEQAASRGRFATSFREAMLRSYAGEVARSLDGLQQQIHDAIAALNAEPGNPIWTTSLQTSLEMWSGLRRPIQIHEAARGLDDPASAEIFSAVRSLAVSLSNDHSEFEAALRLGRALRSSFALVPRHHFELQRDLPTMIGNAAMRRAKQLHERATDDLRSFARQVDAGGLDRAAGLTGSIAALVEDVADLAAGDALEGVFFCLRDIGIGLNNVAQERSAACALLKWLGTQEPPATVAQKLEEDLRHFGIDADIPVRATSPSASPER